MFVAATLNVAFFIKFLGYLRAFPSTGFFVRMLLEIFGDLFDFTIITLLFLLSFSMAFYMLFSRVNPTEYRYIDHVVDDDEGREDMMEQLRYVKSNFGDYTSSVITTWLMLLGDWDPDLMRGIRSENVPGMEVSWGHEYHKNDFIAHFIFYKNIS